MANDPRASNQLFVCHLSSPNKGGLNDPTAIDNMFSFLSRSYPPFPVLRSAIDTYFSRCHNQPYSFFHEASFRQRLASGELPRCLILAILSCAVKFSDHEYFAGKPQASSEYARESWLSVLTEHMAVEENLNLHVVQTVNLLAVVDYTGEKDLQFLNMAQLILICG